MEIIKPEKKVSGIRRVLTVYSFLIVLVSGLIVLPFLHTENYYIIVFLILFFASANIALILLSKVYRIVIELIFDDTNEAITLNYYEYGLFKSTSVVPYSALQYLLLSRYRIGPPPDSVRLYQNDKFIVEIRKSAYNWSYFNFLELTEKLSKVGKRKLYAN